MCIGMFVYMSVYVCVYGALVLLIYDPGLLTNSTQLLHSVFDEPFSHCACALHSIIRVCPASLAHYVDEEQSTEKWRRGRKGG